jgi:mitogen-activated protein kinase 15
MISSISQFKVKSVKDWFRPEVPVDAINLLSKMLSFDPSKRPTADEILRHPYLEQFHNTKDEIESPKIVEPPISDNKKLNLKQYRQLIYERIKKIYRSGAGEEDSAPIQKSSHSIHRNQSDYKSHNKEDSSTSQNH